MSFLLFQEVLDAARRYPDRLAISDGKEELTYAELDQVSSRVGATLQRAGIGAGDRVGVLASKSTRCFAAILGASRAGGCYVPVDPRGPATRSRYILENAEIDFLITESRPFERAGCVPGKDGIPELGRILWVDEAASNSPGRITWDGLDDPASLSSPDQNQLDPAYFLYTSGSTGTPKGVVISHLNARTFVEWGRETFSLSPEDRLSNHAPFHFDLSVFDLYGALTSGASVHLVPDAIAPFPGALAKWIHEKGITVWYSVPSALVRILDQGDSSRFSYPQLRAVLFAGEVFPIRKLREVMGVFPTARFHNLYGPTETNVCTHFEVPRPLPADVADIPIGASCPNMEAFGLSDDGARCTEGQVGELVFRGPCVMLGYWGLPQLTAESLVQNPLHDRYIDPIYRTGDRVRALAGGSFQFLGRTDHMV
ncbi:MAG: amino acid adenylation domain-containing protein, partial [Longimicrobiales bacterium]